MSFQLLMYGALNYRVMAIFCPEYKKLLRNMKLQCLKLFIMTKKDFWRISVKFHLWVPLNALTYILKTFCRQKKKIV